ncbi:hypothetical protein BCEP4_1020022 [Burkholderia cepacia]|nr:hypothetical protein BCEP4_1020022 [Burkholderia cepacia]
MPDPVRSRERASGGSAPSRHAVTSPHWPHTAPSIPPAPPDSGAIARTQYDSADDAGDRFDVTARPRRRRIAKLAVSRTQTAAV